MLSKIENCLFCTDMYKVSTVVKKKEVKRDDLVENKVNTSRECNCFLNPIGCFLKMLRDLQDASEKKLKSQRIYFWFRPNVFSTYFRFVFGFMPYLFGFFPLFLRKCTVALYCISFYFVPLATFAILC